LKKGPTLFTYTSTYNSKHQLLQLKTRKTANKGHIADNGSLNSLPVQGSVVMLGCSQPTKFYSQTAAA